MASTKTIKLTLKFDGDSAFNAICVLPMATDESKQIVKDCDNNPIDAYDNLLAEIGNNNIMFFYFAAAYSMANIKVTDASDEELYSDEEFEVCPKYGLSSMEEAEENYSEDEEELDNYKNYLSAEFQNANTPEEKGIEKAWKGLSNNTVCESTFIPSMLGESIKAAGASEALLRAESDFYDYDSSVTFHIEIPEDEEFDIDKLDFINVDEEYDDNSHILNELLAGDIVLLNAIIYDGKIYFIKDKDYCDASGDTLYDIVNEDIESEIC